MTFLYEKSLGFVHFEDRVVMVNLLTSRTPSMLIPGGTKLFGEVVSGGIRRVDSEALDPPFIPESLHLGLVALAKALESGDGVPYDPFQPEIDGTKSPSPYRNHGEFWILAYTEDDAVTFAHALGMRVQENCRYHCDNFWKRLAEIQKREERSERT